MRRYSDVPVSPETHPYTIHIIDTPPSQSYTEVTLLTNLVYKCLAKRVSV